MNKLSRRDALLSTLFGSGLIGLRALATGLPASFLMNPRKALADTTTCTNASKAQYVILSTSSAGDPINAGAPGTYEDSNIVHSPDPAMVPTQLTLAGNTVTAAQPWSTLPQNVLDRTVFFHMMTNTPIHPKEPDVLKLMGATAANGGNDMLPSLLARQLAPCLNTIQAQPISLGATSPAEAITFGGAPQPIIPPIALAATLAAPTGPLASLGQLRSLRDQTMNGLYALYKDSNTSPAQQAYMDSMVTSQTQLRQISQSLLSQLSKIKDNTATSQCLAACILIQMNVTPVVSIHIPFGGDNHSDTSLQTETAQTISGVQTIAYLMQTLASAGYQDKVSFMTLNVFGRTLMINQPGVSAANGRNHNPNLQTSVVIGAPFKGGVVGGVAPVGNDYGATAIGSIAAADTMAAFGQTMLSAVGGDPSVVSGPTASVVSSMLA